MNLGAARDHPAVLGLAQSEEDCRRLGDFAEDLARWVYGVDPMSLGVLTQLLVRVGGNSWTDTRWLCAGRPLLAVEAGVRSAVALWPLLRTLVEAPGKDAPCAEAATTVFAAATEGGSEVGWTAATNAAAALSALERFLPGSAACGNGTGALEVAVLAELAGWTEVLRGLPSIVKLADALGRAVPCGVASTAEGGSEEVSGLMFAGELSRALPSEIALLADDTTSDLVLHRLMERRLASVELSGGGFDGASTRKRRGPVIACIDTSASMEGAPELWAKALVLAVARRALPQGRVMHLLLFGGPRERTELTLRAGGAGLAAWLRFLRQGFRSGTDFDGPLLRAVEWVNEQGLDRADILVVTDGLCEAAPDVVRRVAEVRSRGVVVYSVVVGRAETTGVRPFSDHVWALVDEGDGVTELLARL